jgi:hypothetical protein
MTHDFTGKSIKCDTWEQMLHLAKLAEEQGYEKSKGFSEILFGNYGGYFTIVGRERYTILVGMYDPIETTYSEFTKTPLPTEVVEVTGCGDCKFHAFRGESERNYCSIESKYETDKPLFDTCPLLTKSITIKLKQNESEGN